ncbi:Ionotropic receptor 783 [Blattella germanica]|nr:Ionotropic receptor 783 [Blattella germanica]
MFHILQFMLFFLPLLTGLSVKHQDKLQLGKCIRKIMEQIFPGGGDIYVSLTMKDLESLPFIREHIGILKRSAEYAFDETSVDKNNEAPARRNYSSQQNHPIKCLKTFYDTLHPHAIYKRSSSDEIFYMSRERIKWANAMNHFLPQTSDWSGVSNRNISMGAIKDSVLLQIHSQQSWTLVVETFRKNFVQRYAYRRFDGFLLFLLAEDIEDLFLIDHISMSCSLPKGKIILIILGKDNKKLDNVFNKLNTLSLYETIVIDHNSSTVNILTVYPEKCGSFGNISILNSWKDGKFIQNIKHLKFHRLKGIQGCNLYILGRNHPPFLITEKGSPTGIIKDGIDFRLIQLIAFHWDLNIQTTTLYERRKDVVYSDYTHPFFESKIHPLTYMQRFYTLKLAWFVPRAQSYLHWSSVTRVFSTEVWLSVALVIILVSLSLKSSLITVAVLLNISVPKMPKSNRIRFVFFTWIIFSFAFTSVFQVFMTSFFTDPGFQHQIDTIEEMDSSGLNQSLDSFHSEYYYLMIGNKSFYIVFLKGNSQLLKYAVNNSNTAVMTSVEAFLHYYPRVSKRRDATVFHMLSEDSLSITRFFTMDSTSAFLPFLNEIIRRLVEGGIVDRIAEDFVDPEGLRRGYNDLKWYNKYAPLSIFEIFSAFLYLCSGLGLSFSVFIFEMIIFSASRYMKI